MRTDLVDCSYEPLPGETLFHYCATSSLEAILESRTLWLTSLDSLNDGTELKWGRSLVTKELEKSSGAFDRDFRMAVHLVFSQADLHIVPLIFSLSAKEDLLSQWRAYASDGDGVAIEFDAEKLQAATPVNMKRVLYHEVDQVAAVRSSLRSFYSCWKKGDEAAKAAVLEVLPQFAMDLLALKHPTFFEEQEVRMVHLLVRDGRSFFDPGGHT